jgi:hypothetical protein
MNGFFILQSDDVNMAVETPDVIQFEESLYQNERCNRKLYADTNVHSAMILLILTLLLDIKYLSLISLSPFSLLPSLSYHTFGVIVSKIICVKTI